MEEADFAFLFCLAVSNMWLATSLIVNDPIHELLALIHCVMYFFLSIYVLGKKENDG